MAAADQDIYFYSHNKKYGCFSNFYESSFIVNKINFNCNEQYFMYCKALLFESDLANDILALKNPADIKKYGRKIKNFDQKKWDDNKFNIMKTGLLCKFSQNKDILAILLDTGNANLYEASANDAIWGIGFSVASDKSKYGQNLLGIALMQVRKELRN